MAYEKTNWTEETPINTDNLNKMEQGIEDAHNKSTGIVNSKDISDKTVNTYSAEIIDGLVKDVYSLEEQVVGTWTNGKPLYKRTYDNYTVSTGTENVEYYIFDTDLTKNLKKAEGTIWVRSGGYFYPSIIGSGGVDFGPTEVTQNGSSGAIYVARKDITNASYITVGIEVTIYYTKTTD